MTTKPELDLLINKFIQKNTEKKRVCSSWDISDYVDGKTRGEYDEAELDLIVNWLLEQRLIYRMGDKESYRTLVRDKGLISVAEFSFVKSLKESRNPKHRLKIVDTEFPIDDEGRYILDA